jgi:hypothetical protein
MNNNIKIEFNINIYIEFNSNSNSHNIMDNKREETLQLLEENIKQRVLAGDKIPCKNEDKWRDIPDLIRRMLTAIPVKQIGLHTDLQRYSVMISKYLYILKASYTRDIPFHTMRMHLITIIESHNIPILNTRSREIDTLWHRTLVEIFHNLRYDSNTVAIRTNPSTDELV